MASHWDHAHGNSKIVSFKSYSRWYSIDKFLAAGVQTVIGYWRKGLRGCYKDTEARRNFQDWAGDHCKGAPYPMPYTRFYMLVYGRWE